MCFISSGMFASMNKKVSGITPKTLKFAQNASEFMSYINEMYLANGYEIQSVQFVRVIPPVSGEAPQYEFAYHLVKELGVPKSK